jgi:hypothetical protein
LDALNKTCEIDGICRRRSACWLPYAVLGWLLFVPTLATARPSENIAVELSAPDACPDSAALLRRVDAQLGADFETDTRLRATISVQALSAAEYSLQLRYAGDRGLAEQRSLIGESCSTVIDAAALVLALALDPSPADTSLAQTSDELAAAVVTPEPPWAHVAALTELDSALFKRLSVAFGLQLGMRVGPIELRVRAQYFLPRAIALADTTSTFNAFSFDLAACAPWTLGRFVLSPCVRAELGRIAANIAGPIEEPRPGAARFQAVGAGGEVRIRIYGPLWLSLAADFTWFLRRPQFVVTDLGEVNRPRQFGLRSSFGPLLAW